MIRCIECIDLGAETVQAETVGAETVGVLRE